MIQFPKPIFLIILPLPHILSPIRPLIHTISLNNTLLPVPLIKIPIFPYILSLTMLKTIQILPFIRVPLRPLFKTSSILQIISPLTSINSTIPSSELPKPFNFIIYKISFIKITFRNHQLAFSMSKVSFHLSNVSSSVVVKNLFYVYYVFFLFYAIFSLKMRTEF